VPNLVVLELVTGDLLPGPIVEPGGARAALERGGVQARTGLRSRRPGRGGLIAIGGCIPVGVLTDDCLLTRRDGKFTNALHRVSC
jgi:hypothetical protein